MDRQEIVTPLQLEAGARLVQICFLTGQKQDQPYTYKTLINVAINDLVVVEARDTYAFARVVGFVDQVSHIDYSQLRHVVTKVDLEAFEKVKAAEAEVMKRLAMSEINRRLQEVSALTGGVDHLRAVPGLLGAGSPAPWTVKQHAAASGETEGDGA